MGLPTLRATTARALAPTLLLRISSSSVQSVLGVRGAQASDTALALLAPRELARVPILAAVAGTAGAAALAPLQDVYSAIMLLAKGGGEGGDRGHNWAVSASRSSLVGGGGDLVVIAAGRAVLHRAGCEPRVVKAGDWIGCWKGEQKPNNAMNWWLEASSTISDITGQPGGTAVVFCVSRAAIEAVASTISGGSLRLAAWLEPVAGERAGVGEGGVFVA